MLSAGFDDLKRSVYIQIVETLIEAQPREASRCPQEARGLCWIDCCRGRAHALSALVSGPPASVSSPQDLERTYSETPRKHNFTNYCALPNTIGCFVFSDCESGLWHTYCSFLSVIFVHLLLLTLTVRFWKKTEFNRCAGIFTARLIIRKH